MSAPKQFAAVNPQISLTALHDRMVVFAQDADGKLIHVDAAQRGKACNCRCLACNEALIARHGDIKAHSFAHASGTECQFAVDAMLNRLAQELIANAGVFVSPPLPVRATGKGPLGVVRQEETIAACRLRVDSAVLEPRAHPQRPSIVMAIGGRELLLELTYGHRLDAHKRGAIDKLGIAAIEMHVGEGQFDTMAQFEHQLLHEVEHKHWIFNPKANAIQAKLDAAVAGRLAEQNAQLAREREAAREEALRRDALNAAREERLREEMLRRDALNAAREERLRAEMSAARQAAADKRAAAPAPLAALRYRLSDGGVLLRHLPDGGILLVPETGGEAVLQAFERLGLSFSAELGGFRAATSQLEQIVLALRPFQLSVTSV